MLNTPSIPSPLRFYPLALSLKEVFISEVDVIRQEMQERDVTVEGEFLSEAAMIEEGISEQFSLNIYIVLSFCVCAALPTAFACTLSGDVPHAISGRDARRLRSIAGQSPSSS